MLPKSGANHSEVFISKSKLPYALVYVEGNFNIQIGIFTFCT